jgi:hypothetical protein
MISYQLTHQSSVAPMPRQDFKAVYSRASALLFVAGGSYQGQLAADIWERDLIRGEWTQIDAGGYEPQVVLAATFSLMARELWILDKASFAPYGDVARLVRVNLDTQQTDEVIRWPWSGGSADYWLMADADSSVILVTSREIPAASFATARFGVSESSVAFFEEIGQPLMYPPRDVSTTLRHRPAEFSEQPAPSSAQSAGG